MKCIKKENEIKRVDDNTAHEMVKEGWEYTSKSEWKKTKHVSKSEKSKK